MSENREYIFFLLDMEDAMQQIFSYTTGLDFSSFVKNRMVVDAVIRNFEVIGEAAKNLPEIIKDKYPAIPWKKMYLLRIVVSHEYFGIDYEVIWKIISEQLPENYAELTKTIEQEKRKK